MKRLILVVFLFTFFAGCSTQETFETLADVYSDVQQQDLQEVIFDLPEDASLYVMEGQTSGKLYFCNQYTITVQTMQSGDLDATIRQITGYSKDDLTAIETKQNNARRYDLVWTSATEEGDQVGKAVLLDDGAYHYAVSVMANAADAGQLSQTWQELLRSVTLTDTVS